MIDANKENLISQIDYHLFYYYREIILDHFTNITKLCHKSIFIDEKIAALAMEIGELIGEFYENDRIEKLKRYLNGEHIFLDGGYESFINRTGTPFDLEFKNEYIERYFWEIMDNDKLTYRKILKLIEEYAFLINLTMIRKIKNNDVDALIELQNEILKKAQKKYEIEVLQDINQYYFAIINMMIKNLI